MVPYLIGLHIMIDSWRPNRKEDSWRYTAAEMKLRSDAEDDLEDEDPYDHTDAPETVKPDCGIGVLEGIFELAEIV
jgi:hypothetical protein